MPSHHWYHCEQCHYRALRYRDVKRCPDCKGSLVREEPEQEVGAALEGGAFGIRALAVSLEMASVYHLTGDDEADYSAAMAATYQFAQHLLTEEPPQDVHALNVNVPSDATTDTPWWVTRLSQLRRFLLRRPTAPGVRTVLAIVWV